MCVANPRAIIKKTQVINNKTIIKVKQNHKQCLINLRRAKINIKQKRQLKTTSKLYIKSKHSNNYIKYKWSTHTN